MKWNRINHISDFCGSIWGFFGLCRDTPCIASQLWWEKAAGGAGALSQPGLERVQGAILLETPKVQWGIWGVSWEPFPI